MSKPAPGLRIDFTGLNKLIVPESRPFPPIEDLIVKTRDRRWLSALDINSSASSRSIPLRQKDFTELASSHRLATTIGLVRHLA